MSYNYHNWGIAGLAQRKYGKTVKGPSTVANNWE